MSAIAADSPAKGDGAAFILRITPLLDVRPAIQKRIAHLVQLALEDALQFALNLCIGGAVDQIIQLIQRVRLATISALVKSPSRSQSMAIVQVVGILIFLLYVYGFLN